MVREQSVVGDDSRGCGSAKVLPLQESLDLFDSLLVLGHVEVLLNDSNKHIQDDDYTSGQNMSASVESIPCDEHLQLARMNQPIRKEAPIQAVPYDCSKDVTLYRISVQFSLERT